MKSILKLSLMLLFSTYTTASSAEYYVSSEPLYSESKENTVSMISTPLNAPKLMNEHGAEFKFDLSRYLGTWYEQAHLPTFFQKNCDSSNAEYSLNADKTVAVLNTCNKSDGTSSTILGTAKINDKDPSGRSLIVSFNFINDVINFFVGTNYYVYYVDEWYNYAIVGTPKKDMLWILTREQKQSQENVEHLIKMSQDLGFDVSKIIVDKR